MSTVEERKERYGQKLIINCERFRKEIVERKGKFNGMLCKHMADCKACKDFVDDLRSKWLLI